MSNLNDYKEAAQDIQKADNTREELDRLEIEFVNRWYLSEKGDTTRVKSADRAEMKRQMDVIIQSEITKAIETKSKIDNGDWHKVLFHYAEVCERQGSLSPEAVTIRMNLSTHLSEHSKTVDELIAEIPKAQEQLLDELDKTFNDDYISLTLEAKRKEMNK